MRDFISSDINSSVRCIDLRMHNGNLCSEPKRESMKSCDSSNADFVPPAAYVRSILRVCARSDDECANVRVNVRINRHDGGDRPLFS